MDSYGLTDLIEVGLLQKIQDSFAAATRFHVLTSDALGQPVTRHSHPTPLCALLECETLQRAVGRPLDPEAARAWAATPQQAMGLVNFVDEMTRLNRGMAVYCTADRLGQYVLDSFAEGRRQRRRL